MEVTVLQDNARSVDFVLSLVSPEQGHCGHTNSPLPETQLRSWGKWAAMSPARALLLWLFMVSLEITTFKEYSVCTVVLVYVLSSVKLWVRHWVTEPGLPMDKTKGGNLERISLGIPGKECSKHLPNRSGMLGGRGREKSIPLLPSECAPIGDRTCSILMHRMVLSQLSHSGQADLCCSLGKDV